MKSFGTPRPDGFPPRFYQHFWYILKDEVVGVVHEYFPSKQVLGRLNHNFLALIPKIEEARTIYAFRPISLCNAIYKIISKVVAN